MTSYQPVLDFWFIRCRPEQWWQKSAVFEQFIRDKFASLQVQAKQCVLCHWRTKGWGRLAEILILDQFSRNLYRDSPLLLLVMQWH